MNRCTQTNEVRYSHRSWINLQVSFESLFCLTKFLNVAMVRNFEVMLGQSLKRTAEIRNFMQCHIV
jgi:hypothetical protein